MAKTFLYGLVEGIMGTHEVDKSPQEVLSLLPTQIKKKCSVSGNAIKAYSACDG